MEIWDLYNLNGEVIGEHVRGTEMPEDGYHLVFYDGEIRLSEASTDEVAKAEWMTRDEIVPLYRSGKMVRVIKDLSYFIENEEDMLKNSSDKTSLIQWLGKDNQ